LILAQVVISFNLDFMGDVILWKPDLSRASNALKIGFGTARLSQARFPN